MPNGLESTSTAVLDPLYTLWLSLKTILPGLVAAIIVLIIGYFTALVIGHVVKLILEKIGLDAKLKKAKLVSAIGHTHWSIVLGEITKWYIFIIFLQVAVDLLAIGTLTSLLDRLVRWLPNAIAAILVFIVGLAVAHLMEIKVTEHTQMKGMKMVGSLLRLVVIILALVIGLRQLGLEISLIENLILIIVAAIAIGMALALGIGLGLGLKNDAARWILDFKRKNF
ncbi:hypothetical protein HYX18_00220 [Candidatus Woesearchaeota archaeon]|nr:hypothetical protein [Candidatus Woesearchaeota archaeon]